MSCFTTLPLKCKISLQPSKKSPGKVPKRTNKAEREKLKREHLNELFLELDGALGSYATNPNGPYHITEFRNMVQTAKLDIASSSSGEIKLSLSCNSDKEKAIFTVTNMDTILKRMDEKCLKSYRVFDPKFSVKKLMEDIPSTIQILQLRTIQPKKLTISNHVQATLIGSTSKLDIASSLSGEIKFSLSCNSDKEKAIFTVTNVDTVLKRMDEKNIGSDSSDEPTVGTDATTGFPMSDTLICYILLYMHVFQMPHIMGGFDPCLEDYVTSYYNSMDVLHGWNWEQSKDYVLPIYKILIDLKLRIWVYRYRWESPNIVHNILFKFSRPTYHSSMDALVAGWLQEYERLSYDTFKGVGHNVPSFKPSCLQKDDELAMLDIVLPKKIIPEKMGNS
ncbi:serine carboxypeptidase-like protein 31 [Tanacetum coccineum]